MMLGQPVRDRRAERHQATKDEILAAAWDIVRTEGLTGLSLRDLARRVGMQPPSLYVYFDSKHAIYDAMFAQGYRENRDLMAAWVDTGNARTDLREGARWFVRFCVDDPARFQLLFHRTIPGFTPSDESYAIAVEGYEDMRARMARHGITTQAQLDLWTGLLSGLASQQIANDPGGDRWIRIINDAVDMFLNHVTSKKRGKR